MSEIGEDFLPLGVIHDNDFDQYSRIKTNRVGEKWEKKKREKFHLYTNFSKKKFLIPPSQRNRGIKIAKETSVWGRLNCKKKVVAGLVTGMFLTNER